MDTWQEQYLGVLSVTRSVFFFGASVPFVLRERDDGGFMFLGEAYVHGLMDGEALKEFDIESLSQDFKIH